MHLSGSYLISKDDNLGYKFFLPCHLRLWVYFFCDDYFKVALLFQGSPNCLSMFYPNLSPGWLAQVYAIEEIMRM